MDNVTRMASGLVPVADRVEGGSGAAARSIRPPAKFDPEYDIRMSAQWFRNHGRLLLQLSEAGETIDNLAVRNLLSHVAELLFFTVGWLENHRDSGPTALVDAVIDTASRTYEKMQESAESGSKSLVELGMGFDELAAGLESLTVSRP
jgi:hypothetical protein